VTRWLGLLSVFFVSACATIHPSYRDERFVILSSGDFTPRDVQRVRDQLEVGTQALERYIGSIPSTKFPIVVNLALREKGEGLVDEWLGVVTALPIDTAEARAFYAQMKSFRR